MRALVTGANGHIGSHVVRACLAAGLDPVAFVRPKADLRALHGVDVERRVGDLLDADSVRRACDGVEVLRDAFRWLLFVDALKPKAAAKVRAALGDRAAPDADWTR